jgi:hypothetical protein
MGRSRGPRSACPILDKENGGPEMFGFRVGDAANQLSLDGGDCTAADGLDDPHRPRRTRSKR